MAIVAIFWVLTPGLAIAESSAARAPRDQLAFVAEGNDGALNVYLTSPTGAGTHRLDAGQAPAWSPDGKRLALQGGTSANTIVVESADGTRRHDTLAVGSGPEWSPDGQTIAFLRLDGGIPFGPSVWHVWLMRPDGSGQRLLSAVPDGSEPSWSPDSRRMAFVGLTGFVPRTDVGWDAEAGRAIYVMPAGADPVSYVLHPMVSRLSPTSVAWSPDGSLIAFTGLGGLWVMHPDGSGLHNILPWSEAAYADIGPVPLYASPYWSPDGRRLAVTIDGEATVLNRDGSGRHAISVGSVVPWELTWSPDSRNVALCRYQNWDGVVVNVTTGKISTFAPSDPHTGGPVSVVWSPR